MGNTGCCYHAGTPDMMTKEVPTRNQGDDEVVAFDASSASPPSKGVPATTACDDAGMSDEEDRKRLAAQKGQSRRQAVAAQGMSAGEVRDFVKPVYPKDEESSTTIKAILKTNEKMQVLSGHLGDAALDDIVNAFQHVKKAKGEEVIRQGEEGDCLYIIKAGAVDVFVARPGPDGKLPEGRGPKVVSLGPGALFGELALMYSAPRAASVCITSPTCELWQLDREPFKMLLAQSNQSQYTLYEGWLSDVALLKSLNHYELSRLSELLESTLFDTGEEIITQGEPGDKFYILEDGSCAAYMTGSQGERKVAEYSTPGEYFGEVALLTSEPRKATIRATGEGCTVLSLSQEDFMLILGPIQDILKNDLSKYKQYAQYLC